MTIQSNEFGDTCILSLSGRLNRFNFTDIRLRGLQAVQKGFKRIVLNLSRVVAIDPIALDTVVYLYQFAEKNEASLALVALDNTKNTIRMSAPDLQVFDTENDALSFLRDRTAVVTEITGQKLLITKRQTVDYCEIVLQGDLEITTLLPFKEMWQKEILTGQKKYLLNITQIEHLDSSGIGTTVVFYKNILKMGGKMVILCRSHIQYLFQLSGMKGFLNIMTDEIEARNALRM